jgi:hypothetical protein
VRLRHSSGYLRIGRSISAVEFVQFPVLLLSLEGAKKLLEIDGFARNATDF